MVEVCKCEKVKKRIKRKPKHHKKRQQVIAPPAPVPITQYVYRDNLALNILNDKLKEINDKMKTKEVIKKEEEPKPVTKSMETQTNKTNTKSTKSQTLKPLLPPPATLLAKHNVERLANSSSIHSSTTIPTQTEKEDNEFTKMLNPTRRDLNDDENDADNEEETQPRLNKNGLPDRRTKAGKEYYKQMMEKDTVSAEIVDDDEDEG